MKSNSLRAEFVLTGGSFLVGLYLFLVEVLGWDGALGPWLDPQRGTGLVLERPAAALIFSGTFVAVAAVAGAGVVMLTFLFPGRWISARSTVRAAKDLKEALTGSTLLPRDSCAARVLCDIDDTWTGGGLVAQEIALLLARGRGADPDAASQADYRRSNRQLFLGLLPAGLLGGSAAVVAASHNGLLAASSIVVALLGGIALFCVGAAYQERKTVDDLLRAAIWNTRDQDDDGASPPPRGTGGPRRRWSRLPRRLRIGW